MKDRLKKVNKPAQLLKTKKKKLGKSKEKVKIQSMSVDEFMNDVMNDNNLENEDNESEFKKVKKKKLPLKKNKVDKLPESEAEDEDESYENSEDENESGLDYENTTTHKKQLDSLKKSDPEFYKYLEENDQELLNFNDSDSDFDEEKDEKVHKPPNELEVASDESDYEPDENVLKARKGKSNRITKEIIEEWQKQLLSKNNVQTMRQVVEAFHAALLSVSPNNEEEATSMYKVEGAVIFNSIMRLCIVDFLPALQKTLKINSFSKVHPEKCPNWSKVKTLLKSYFSDLLEFCSVTSPSMLQVLLKHIHQMSPVIACFPSLSQKFLRRVIQLWAMDEEVVRVLSFLCALRLANLRPTLLKLSLKSMHLTYVKNTRFVSPSTLPGINFMRQSLCEMFALDTTTAYQMGFLYIRQLAVHLRNAVTLKKKESYRAVYNWAYISCLHLWAELFGLVPRNSPLRSLLYPLVQIIIGTIKLMPSSQYYPLRFHCVKILIGLSKKCEVFIPILPFLLEVLKEFNFNREHKKLSMKPMDLTCLLRCSKSQMKENGFKDAVIENVHDLLMEYLAGECYKVSFPDMTVLCVIELKIFLKTCKVVNYTKKIKAILEKVTENSKFIEQERKKFTLRLDDFSGIEAAETSIRLKGPPFLKYYESWKKIHMQQQARKVTNNEKLGDFKLPVLYKLDKKKSRAQSRSVGPPELFPSSDEEDSASGDLFKEIVSESEEVQNQEPPKKKKKKEVQANSKTPSSKSPKPIKTKIEKDAIDDYDGEDIVKDFDISEFS